MGRSATEKKNEPADRAGEISVESDAMAKFSNDCKEFPVSDMNLLEPLSNPTRWS